MSDSIGSDSRPFLVRADESVEPTEPVPLSSRGKGTFDESWLQRLIHADSRCLPLEKIEPGLGPFVSVCREMPVGAGYVDNLLMSPSGDIVVVETKLWRNPEARREVLAQALDYAVAVFGLDYAGFEAAVLKGDFRPASKPTSLYQLFENHSDALAEPKFIDAVARNLKLGRAVIVVAGDGIQSGAERLLDGLKDYAQFQFTLALVEMPVFRMAGENDRLVWPRLLAKTEMLTRHVFEVRISGGAGESRVVVEDNPDVVKTDLTKTNFWETLEQNCPGGQRALEELVRRLEPYGVYAELLASLNLKWQPPGEAKPVNLGYFKKSGQIFTDAASWHGRRELALPYVRELSQVFGVEYREIGDKRCPTLYDGGKPLNLRVIVEKLGQWEEPARRFIEAIRKDAEEQ